jgi:hypothetical protein
MLITSSRRDPGEPAPNIGVVMIGSERLLSMGLNGPGHYLHWGVIQISVANLVVIVVMIVLFVAAILLPFPGTRRRK